jgi:hypothetical protein
MTVTWIHVGFHARSPESAGTYPWFSYLSAGLGYLQGQMDMMLLDGILAAGSLQVSHAFGGRLLKKKYLRYNAHS